MTSGPAHFGEQGGLLTYGEYLRLAELLAQQVPESRPRPHDELLFITIHQVYELWFKLLLAELTDARDRMLAGEDYLPRVRLERAPRGRAGAGRAGRRDRHDDPAGLPGLPHQLAPASGFQSAQFREIEFLSGLKDPASSTGSAACADAERDRLQRRLAEPSLWDALPGAAGRGRLRVPSRRRSGSRALLADRRATGSGTARCGTSPRRCSTTTRRGRCGGPGTC